MSTLYERIETLCASQEINITQMCKGAGIPRSTLSDYKSNRIKSIATDKLSKIANYFGVSVDYLLTGEEPEQKEKPSTEEDDVTFDDFTYAMYNESKDLSEASKQKLLEMARFFKDHIDKEKE